MWTVVSTFVQNTVSPGLKDSQLGLKPVLSTCTLKVFVIPDSLPKTVTFVFLSAETDFGVRINECPDKTTVDEKLISEPAVMGAA